MSCCSYSFCLCIMTLCTCVCLYSGLCTCCLFSNYSVIICVSCCFYNFFFKNYSTYCTSCYLLTCFCTCCFLFYSRSSCHMFIRLRYGLCYKLMTYCTICCKSSLFLTCSLFGNCIICVFVIFFTLWYHFRLCFTAYTTNRFFLSIFLACWFNCSLPFSPAMLFFS